MTPAALTGPIPNTPGTPAWLVVASSVVVIVVALFGQGAGKAAMSALRNRRRGIAVRETDARAQEQENKRLERTAEDEQREKLIERMGNQLDDQARMLSVQGREIEELREWQRQQFERDVAWRGALMEHGGWDFRAVEALRRASVDLGPIPPLTPPPVANPGRVSHT